MKLKIILIVTLCCLIAACAEQSGFPSGEWIDLSYDFSDKTVYWTESDNFVKQTVAEGQTEKGYYYSAYKFSAPEHGGTHLDAPVHFAENRQTVDQIPLTRLIAPTIKIDVSLKASANRDYQVSVEDFKAWEAQHGNTDASIVLLQPATAVFGGPRKYMGMRTLIKHFPGSSGSARCS